MTLTPTDQGIELQESEFSEVAWTPQADLSFNEWMERGGTFAQIHRSIHFWIGDWVKYGEDRWGEKYAQALDCTTFTYGTLRNDWWVANRIPPEIRRPALYWNHHYIAACASEDAETIDRLLAKVERRKLAGLKATTSWFREFVRRWQRRFCGISFETVGHAATGGSFLPVLDNHSGRTEIVYLGGTAPDWTDPLVMFQRANRLKRHWRRRAIKAESELDDLRRENAELYQELMELQKTECVFGKRDWMNGVLD